MLKKIEIKYSVDHFYEEKNIDTLVVSLRRSSGIKGRIASFIKVSLSSHTFHCVWHSHTERRICFTWQIRHNMYMGLEKYLLSNTYINVCILLFFPPKNNVTGTMINGRGNYPLEVKEKCVMV